MKKNEGKTIGIGAEVAREGYEASVISRMSQRAGSCTPKGAPGIALEILDVDKTNLYNIFKPDTITALTKSSTAPQVDAVTTQAGKVIERIQYKDTVSVSGVQKTLNQVKSGKYHQAQLKGTVEAAEKYNTAAKANNVTKTMKSTGISHNTTQRIGDKLTHQSIKAGSLGNAVKSSTVTAVGITTAIELGKSILNEESVDECTSHVVSKGAESAIGAAAATIAAETTSSIVGGLLATSAIPVAGPLIAGIGAALIAGNVASKCTEGVFDNAGSTTGRIVGNVTYDVKEKINSIKDGFSRVGRIFW